MLKEDTYLDNPIPSTIDNLNEINDLENNPGKEQFNFEIFYSLKNPSKKAKYFLLYINDEIELTKEFMIEVLQNFWNIMMEILNQEKSNPGTTSIDETNDYQSCLL